MKKKRWTQSLGNFVEGKGFYIVLLLCLAVIGLSTYYLLRTFHIFGAQPEEPLPVSGTASISVTETVSPATETPTPTTSPTSTPTQAPEETSEPAVALAEPEPQGEDVMAEITTWPLQGTVIAAFSPDALQLNATMGDWRTHNGIDLSAELGTNVQAVGDGVVTEIREDLLLGTVLTIDHGGSLTSSYANLAPELLVSTGDHVTAGCVIGQVGQTAAGELAQDNHLHFSMALSGESVNPEDYLP